MDPVALLDFSLLARTTVKASGSGSWMIFAGFAAFTGGAFYLAARANKKRQAAMAAVAEELRLQYHPGEGPLSLAELDPFHLAGQGRSRRISNVLAGAAGDVDVAIFDYTYTTGGSDNSSTTRTTVVRFRSAALNLPTFELRPENIFHKMGQALGGQDIDFPSHPVFSKKFLLKGEDEAGVQMLFDETLLTELEERKGISVEGRRQEMLFYKLAQTEKPEGISALLQEAHGVYARFADAAQRSGAAR